MAETRTGTKASRMRGRGRRAFTLVEMLVAAAILAIFGLMAAATLRYGSGLWSAGNRRSAAYDVASVIFQQIANDVGAAKHQFWNKDRDAFDTRIRFWVDDPDGDTATPGGPLLQRLRFVRGIPDDVVNPRIRQAGDGQDNDGDGLADEEIYNLKDDDLPPDGLVDEDLMPLEGLAEVAYMMGLDADPSDGFVDHTTLYRAVRAPIGGANSLFVDGTIDTAAEVAAAGVPVAQNVLYLEFRCWTQYTTTWNNGFPFKRWSISPEPCGPTRTWDSGRRTGPAPPPPLGPEFVMDWGFTDPRTGVLNFPDADDDLDGDDNSEDADYVRDNVFPSAVLVVVTVAPPGDMARANPLRLAAGIGPADTTIQLRGSGPPLNTSWPFVRVGDEWMLVSAHDTEAKTMTVERGHRGTTAVPHPADARIGIGYTFSRVFHNPAGRDYW